MTPTRRIVATLVATAALVAPTTLTISTAEAAKPASAGKPTKPTKPGKPAKAGSTSTVKSQLSQLLKDIAVRDQQLARLATSDAVTTLADDSEAVVVANIAAARATLAELRAAAQAGGSTFDARAARRQLHAFRVENLREAVEVLHEVEALAPAAATDPEAQAYLDQAKAGALALGVSSTKADVQAVQALVAAAEAELAPVEPVV